MRIKSKLDRSPRYASGIDGILPKQDLWIILHFYVTGVGGAATGVVAVAGVTIGAHTIATGSQLRICSQTIRYRTLTGKKILIFFFNFFYCSSRSNSIRQREDLQRAAISGLLFMGNQVLFYIQLWIILIIICQAFCCLCVFRSKEDTRAHHDGFIK